MSTVLTIRDEEMSGKVLNEFSLECLTEKITVRELIRSRVYQEVKDHNASQGDARFKGLVQPSAVEESLNGPRRKSKKMIDWKAQFDKAVEAFQKNQILMIVDDRQVESLDEQIEVAANTTVAFLRLTLLVGG